MSSLAAATASNALGPTPTRFNPLLPEYIVDPHPQLHRLRAEDPVHWSSTLGVWMITRYADVMAILHDRRFSSMAGRWDQYPKFFLRGGSTSSPMAEMYSKWMLQVDPPDHTRLRALVNKAFTPRAVEAMRPRIQRMVDELLDPVIPTGRMDVMADIGFPLPVLVICDLLGVPRSEYSNIRQWTQDLLRSLSPAISAQGMARVNEVIVKLREYFRSLANERRKQPKDDMMSALLAAREQGDKLNEEELLATCVLLAFAGHATTAQLTGKGMLVLLQNPDQLELLRSNPSLIVGAVEEMLRYEGTLQMVYRSTIEEVTIGGKTIPARQMVFASLAAANRDPAQFPDPDRFDITRDASKHLSFGHGIHYCVGAPLGRLESQIAINTMLRRLPNLKVCATGVRRESSLLLRGLVELPVTFGDGG
jgi:pimeloyl-[acyl-carrier protein] synthase